MVSLVRGFHVLVMIGNEFVLLTLPFLYTLEITVYSLSKYTLCQVEAKPLLDLISTDNYLDRITSVVVINVKR